MHSFLLKKSRLMIGVNHLGELPPKLGAALMIAEKGASGAIYHDALEPAKYDCAFPPGANE
jgi:hypothetical protein